jgi:hypothetical protein
MTRVSRMARAGAIQVLLLFPPIIRDSLLERSAFRETYGLQGDATLSFDDTEISFKRSVLYRAVRRAHANRTASVEVKSDQEETFVVTIEDRDGSEVVVLRRDGGTFALTSFFPFSTRREQRLAGFEREVQGRNLHDGTVSAWRSRLETGPLNDGDLDDLNENLKLTPQGVARAIKRQVSTGKSDVPVMVPRQPYYYDRLVGAVDAASRVSEFVQTTAKSHIERLLDWNGDAGLAQSLLLAGHSSISSLIEIDGRPPEKVLEFFRWLAEHGDRFSQVAGLEVALARVDRFPQLEAILLDMARQIRDDDPNDPNGRLKLASSLFVFVDGELARTGVLGDKPPFWRRLAALAQAGLIERELLAIGIVTERFSDWATSGRGQSFFLQNLIDLRVEPRWLPDFAMPQQLKAEFVGRIAAAGKNHAELIASDELREVVAEAGPGSFQDQMKFPFAYLPGPLEGGTVSPVEFPAELASELERPPTGEALDSNFFASVVNSALVFRIGPEHARLAAAAIQRVKHRVNIGTDSDKAFSMLAGLAVVSAVTRTPELADEVRILARIIRHRPGADIEPDSLMRIGLIACASHSSEEDWCKAVGEWFLELAYEKIDGDVAAEIRSHLRRMCQIVPALWITCARAEAALAAVATELHPRTDDNEAAEEELESS